MPIRQYRLEPAAFLPTFRGRVQRGLLWQIPLTVGLTFAFLVVSFRAQHLELAWWWFPIALVAVSGALLAPLPGAMKRARKAWGDFQLTVSENVLHLRTGSTAPIEVLRPEVTRVVERKGLGLLVQSADAGRQIFIPQGLQRFPEVREHLRSWRPIEPPSLARERVLGTLRTLLLLGSWVAAAAVPDIRLAMAAAVVLLGTVGFLMHRVLRERSVDNRLKAKHVLVFAFFAAVPSYRLLAYLLFPS